MIHNTLQWLSYPQQVVLVHIQVSVRLCASLHLRTLYAKQLGLRSDRALICRRPQSPGTENADSYAQSWSILHIQTSDLENCHPS